MSDAFACGRCGTAVPLGAARYDARLQITHTADPLELTAEDLARDHGAEIRQLLREMARRDPTVLEEEVHLTRSIRLCARCRIEVLDHFERRRGRRNRRPR